MNGNILKHRLSAGLEACPPTVDGLGPLSFRIHFATQYGIYLRTIIPETPVFVLATMCDNHGRLYLRGISSTSVRRALSVSFSRKVNLRDGCLFGACTSMRSGRTRAEVLEARSAKKGTILSDHVFSARGNTFLKGTVREIGR